MLFGKDDPPFMFTNYSQQDPRWASLKLGKSPYTVGRYGCTSVCVTDVMNWLLNKSIPPSETVPKLAYTSEGLILWDSLKNLGLSLVGRFYGRQYEVIDKALADPGLCAIAQVNGNHWVWVIGRRLPILGYRIADPWTGTKAYTNRYKNNITGCAIISKK